MRLAAIYNVWDGEELLKGSIDQIRDETDIIIIVSQHISNYGERYRPKLDGNYDIEILYEPDVSKGGTWNETRKRNIGIQKAIQLGCTHYILMDCDEYYDDFKDLKNHPDAVLPLFTYFKHPTYRLSPIEQYFVPGIITITQDIKVGNFNCGYFCDPTRKPNKKLTYHEHYMHHYSYVRNNILRKINNSSAKFNIERRKSVLIEDLQCAKPKYYVKFYKKTIILVPNYFNIHVSPD